MVHPVGQFVVTEVEVLAVGLPVGLDWAHTAFRAAAMRRTQ